MPRLFNVDHGPVIINHGTTAVLPGEPYDFTDDEVKAGISGQWSSNPREGKGAETAWKALRDAEVASPADETAAPTDDPAPSGEDKE